MKGYKIVVLRCGFMGYKVGESEGVCWGIWRGKVDICGLDGVLKGMEEGRGVRVGELRGLLGGILGGVGKVVCGINVVYYFEGMVGESCVVVERGVKMRCDMG